MFLQCASYVSMETMLGFDSTSDAVFVNTVDGACSRNMLFVHILY